MVIENQKVISMTYGHTEMKKQNSWRQIFYDIPMEDGRACAGQNMVEKHIW